MPYGPEGGVLGAYPPTAASTVLPSDYLSQALWSQIAQGGRPVTAADKALWQEAGLTGSAPNWEFAAGVPTGGGVPPGMALERYVAPPRGLGGLGPMGGVRGGAGAAEGLAADIAGIVPEAEAAAPALGRFGGMLGRVKGVAPEMLGALALQTAGGRLAKQPGWVGRAGGAASAAGAGLGAAGIAELLGATLAPEVVIPGVLAAGGLGALMHKSGAQKDREYIKDTAATIMDSGWAKDKADAKAKAAQMLSYKKLGLDPNTLIAEWQKLSPENLAWQTMAADLIKPYMAQMASAGGMYGDLAKQVAQIPGLTPAQQQMMSTSLQASQAAAQQQTAAAGINAITAPLTAVQGSTGAAGGGSTAANALLKSVTS